MTMFHSTPSRTTRPAAKPARSPRQMATAERLRQMHEQGNALADQLHDAIDRDHRTTAHHALDRILDLRTEYHDVLAAAQDDARTLWGWTA